MSARSTIGEYGILK